MEYIWVIIAGVILVAMVVMQFITAKKNKKKQDEMLAQVVIGAEIMTAGGIIGTIVAFDEAKQTMTIASGNTEITLTKKALHSVISSPVRAETILNGIPVPKSAEENIEEKHDDK
jgi:preprotein translocase subunit YajC